MPENGFLKKKDSENHIALLALKKFYELDLLDDYLFPKIGSYVFQKQPPKPSERQLKIK